MHRIDLTPVYVLHTRPFSNTSLIVELFSQAHGRVSVVARSARGEKSRYKGQLQLFTPMLASWSGRHELKTLGAIELNGMPLVLNQKPLFCGFYLNELLMRLMHKEDAHPKLFDCYHLSLCRLARNDSIPLVLRTFEKKILDELGYGLPFLKLHPNNAYQFIPNHGFVQSQDSVDEQAIFSGKTLIAISQEQFESESTLQAAKRLMRLALSAILGDKPLNSRELF